MTSDATQPPTPDEHRDANGDVDWVAFRADAVRRAAEMLDTETPPTEAGGES